MDKVHELKRTLRTIKIIRWKWRIQHWFKYRLNAQYKRDHDYGMKHQPPVHFMCRCK